MNGFLESLHAFITAPIRECSVGWFFVFFSVASMFAPIVGGVLGLLVWMTVSDIIMRGQDKRLRKRERSIKGRAKIRYARKLAKAEKRIRAEVRLELGGWKSGRRSGPPEGPRPEPPPAPPRMRRPVGYCDACGRQIFDLANPRVCHVLSTPSNPNVRCAPSAAANVPVVGPMSLNEWPGTPAPATFRKLTPEEVAGKLSDALAEERERAGEDNGAPSTEPR